MVDQSLSHPVSIRDYIYLTKPGILRSNLIAAFAGFWVASQGDIQWGLFIYMLIGTTLVMASSCVFNNFLDRDYDGLMERTSHRPLPSGRISATEVFIFASILGALGLFVLFLLTNSLAAWLGVVGMVVYVVIYTAWLKRTSTLSTVIGSFSGAMPPVIGYTAVTGSMDAGAWILFGFLFLWQCPHFWALGIRRMEEYRAAGFQILPVVKGVQRTKIQMIPYVVLLIPVSLLLYFMDYAGMYYFITALVMGILWLLLCFAGFVTKDDNRWAKRTFMFSIYYLLITLVVMILDTTQI
ncbi:MAG: heme o synthase [Paenibacillaceae bacterium]